VSPRIRDIPLHRQLVDGEMDRDPDVRKDSGGPDAEPIRPVRLKVIRAKLVAAVDEVDALCEWLDAQL
jgi:hypothetical protein